MSNIDDNAGYGKLYLFLGNYGIDKWHEDADKNDDGQITSSEFLAFINNANWDTDTLGNRPDNDIIGNFFSKMLDQNNIGDHYLDQAEIDNVFTQDKDGNGVFDWKDQIKAFADKIGLSGLNLDQGFAGIADKFKNHSYMTWSLNEEGYNLSYNSSGYMISGLVAESKGMTFTAVAGEGSGDLTDISFKDGTLTFNAPALDVEQSYTITITANGNDGSQETRDITVTIGAKPVEEVPEPDNVDTDDEVQSTGGTGSSSGTEGTKTPNGTFDGNIDWNTAASTTRTVDEGSQVVIDDLVGSTSGVSFSASATGGLNVNCDSATGKITLTAPEVSADATYTVTLTATDADGDVITKDIKLTVKNDEKTDVVVTDDSVDSAGGTSGTQGSGESSGPGYVDGSVEWKAGKAYSVTSGGSTVIQTVDTKNNATFSAIADDGLGVSCNPETGVLNVKAPYASYDESYSITVTAVDPDGDVIATKTITVTVEAADTVDTSDNRGS